MISGGDLHVAVAAVLGEIDRADFLVIFSDVIAVRLNGFDEDGHARCVERERGVHGLHGGDHDEPLFEGQHGAGPRP